MEITTEDDADRGTKQQTSEERSDGMTPTKVDCGPIISKNDVQDWRQLQLVKRIATDLPSPLERYFAPRLDF